MSEALLLSALLVYALATIGFSISRVSERAGGAAVSLTVLAFVLHGAALVSRGITVGRAPLGNMYEFAITTGFAATAAYLLIGRLTGQVRQLGLLAVLPVVITLTLAVVVLYAAPSALVPALQSAWLNVHVTTAAVAVGAVTVGAVGCGMQLHAQRRQRPDKVARADAVARAAFSFAFPVWTFAVTTGAVWAQYAWGRYWGWDPKEVWAFVSWVVLAAYLHARHTAAVRRRTTAIVGIVAYGTLLFNFVGVTLVHVIRDRLPGWFLIGTLGVLELSVLVVSAVGIVRVATTERDVEAATLVGYLIAVLVLVPAATLWSLVERSRFGTAIIILACLAVPVMLTRAQQIWDAAGHAG